MNNAATQQVLQRIENAQTRKNGCQFTIQQIEKNLAENPIWIKGNVTDAEEEHQVTWSVTGSAFVDRVRKPDYDLVIVSTVQ